MIFKRRWGEKDPESVKFKSSLSLRRGENVPFA